MGGGVSSRFSTADIPKFSGKVVIITGGTAGLGLASAIELVRKGARVIITARSQKRGEEAIRKIREALAVKDDSELDVEFGIAEHQDLGSIKAFASWFLAKDLPLHVLMLNAGIAGVPHKIIEGVESTLFVNHVSHHLLVKLLLPKLRQSVPSRIVVVSSDAYKFVKELSLETPSAQHYAGFQAYGNSKLANILFTKALQKRLESDQIFANAIHPGAVATNLADKADAPQWLKSLAMLILPAIFQTSAHGALTQLYAATSPDIEERGLKGQYFYPVAKHRPVLEPYAHDDAAAERLWEWTENKIREVLGDVAAPDAPAAPGGA